MAGSRLYSPGQRVTNPTTGVPLSGATMNTYITGTTTNKTTFSDKALTTANPNPLITNSAGLWENSSVRIDVWGDGGFRFLVKDSAGTTLWDEDPVDAVDTAFSSSAGNAKDSVRCATTANITLSGEQTIDGITTVTDRVLVKNQSSGAENGIYVSAAGAWARSADLNEDAEAEAFWVSVREGTANGVKVFGLTTDGAITVGTTSMTIAEMADPTTEIDTEKKSHRGISTKSAAYTLVAGDAGTVVDLTGGTTRAFTLTVGNFSDDDYGVMRQLGTGNLTFTAGASTTLRASSAFNTTLAARGQYSQVTWERISSTEIILGGDLNPA